MNPFAYTQSENSYYNNLKESTKTKILLIHENFVSKRLIMESLKQNFQLKSKFDVNQDYLEIFNKLYENIFKIQIQLWKM